MNPHSQNLHDLLEHVLPASAPGIGPDRASLLAMLRRERSRRHRTRAIVTAVFTALVAILLFWRAVPREGAATSSAPAVAAPIVIHQVDDQQFLALLKGTPAALMEWPDGQRTLLVMER